MKYEVEVNETGTFWEYRGQLHREDGPALESADGDKFWYIHGELHRENGPAIEWADGDKEWWINGERHREDGPAIEWADGYKEWHIHGEILTEDEFKKRMIPAEMTLSEVKEILLHYIGPDIQKQSDKPLLYSRAINILNKLTKGGSDENSTPKS